VIRDDVDGPAGALAGVLAELGRALPGARLAVLLDTEGLVVASHRFREGPDPAAVAAEVAGCFPGMGRLAAATGLGAGLEWSLAGGGGTLVCRRLPGRELFLAVVADPGEWRGRVRHAVARAAAALAEHA